MLIDSEFTIDTISNKAMMKNIQRSPKPTTLHCNVGSRQVEYTSELKGYGRVWYNQKSIANNLSLSCATRKYRGVFNSKDGNYFRLMLPGREVVFNVSTNGLYFHDTVDRITILLNMVADNREGFTHRDYEGAKEACRALGLVGYPLERDFSNMASSNMNTNCPDTSCDIQNSSNIFGPDVPSTKGKSVRRQLEAVVR